MTFQKEKQKAFHSFVADVMEAQTTEENTIYQSIMGTLYSIIEDDKLDSLCETLKSAYPEYYMPLETAIIRKLHV